jgi:hypothetical protein
MSRVSPLCVLTLLCASIVVGCGKKDESESGGGGGAPSDGQPMLRSRTAEDKREAVAKLRQIGLALHNSHDTYGSCPAGIVGPKGQLGLSWRVAILPFLEEEALYKQFKLDEPWDSEHNKKLLDKMPKVFEAPGTVLARGKTFLRSFSGPQGFIPGPPIAPVGPKGTSVPKVPGFTPWANQPPGSTARGRVLHGVTDGTSNTLMVVEAAEPVEWTKPEDLAFSDMGGSGPTGPLSKLGGLFDGGFHGLMCDGEVRFYSATLSEKKLRALISVAGGEVIPFEPSDFQTSPRPRPGKTAVEGEEAVRPPPVPGPAPKGKPNWK